MIGVLFEMVVMVFGYMWEDKFKTDFDDDNSDNDTNVSFDIDMEK